MSLVSMRYSCALPSPAKGAPLWRRHPAGGLVACALLALAGCTSESTDALTALRQTGQINVAIAIEPPYMVLGPGGTPEGVGPEIDRAVLQAAGIRTMKAEVMEFGAMIPALQARRVAMVSSGGLFVTPERCRSIIYSEPVSCDGDVFILPTALADKITSFKALADSQLTVATCAGCTEQKHVVAAGVPASRRVTYTDGPGAMALLVSKRVDVIAMAAGAGSDLYSKLGDPRVNKLVDVTDGPRLCGGAAFRPDDKGLRDAYNEGFRKVVADGTYLAILKKYHVESTAITPQTPSTAQICAGAGGGE